MDTVRDQARAWVCAWYPAGAQHLLKAEQWARRLKPDASEEVLLATLTHDMERAFPGPDSPIQDPQRGVDDPIYLRAHSDRSARFVRSYLQEQGAPLESIEQVIRLIQAHESGGDEEENLVQAADSLSFLEVNVDLFLRWLEAGDPSWTREAIKAKFTWMYERIRLEQARQLARPLYEEALRKLEHGENPSGVSG